MTHIHTNLISSLHECTKDIDNQLSSWKIDKGDKILRRRKEREKNTKRKRSDAKGGRLVKT